MKTLIISDIHLSHRFDEKKFLYLENLFSTVDQIILNGDFWDAYQTTFDIFISSPWKNLFPLLKRKKTIYLYGNHDPKQLSDERISLFSAVQKEYHLLTVNKEIHHIEHGHLLYKTIDNYYPLSRKTLYYLNSISQRMEHLFLSVGNPHRFITKAGNKKIKEQLREKRFPYWYVCGHTHYAEMDRTNKFANSGFILFGQASYLIVDSSGLSLQNTRY